MPHHFQPAEEAVPLHSGSPLPHQQSMEMPAAPVQAVPQEAATPRYDAETVQQIIALAEQLQTRHRETLSTEEVENLGREIGVEPEFVRRALAQIEGSAKTTAEFEPVRQKRMVDVSLASLTRRQRALAMVPAALYALLMPLTFAWFRNSDNNLAILFYLILPAVLTLYVGVRGKSKRVGALSGVLFALSSLLSLMGNAAYDHGSQPPLPEFFMILAIWLGSGITLGAGGAALRQFVSKPRRRKRLRVRVIVESDDKDDKEERQTSGEWV